MIKSRYATKKVNNNFYKTIDIKKPLNWVVFILFSKFQFVKSSIN
jgi:C1A family cysteine protease